MIYNYKYSLGIYENDWGFIIGSEGNPHVFLGLKKEKIKCNELQIQIKNMQYEYFLKHKMQEEAKQCKIELDSMQCFIDEETLEDLRQKLSKYKYYLTSSKEFKAWKDTELDKANLDDKDFDETLRKEFNNNFTFLRQCYADITEPFFEWLESIKHIKLDSIRSFDKFQGLFDEFIESPYSNLDSIEGFFGFGP